MNPKQISQDDLVLFALQELTPAEAAEVMVHLEHSEAARAELAQIQSDLAMYAITSAPQSPPQQSRERLLRAVAREKKFIPAATAAAPVAHAVEPVLVPRPGHVLHMKAEAPHRRSGMGLFGWAGWAVAACALAAAGFEYHQHQLVQEALYTQKVKLVETIGEAARAEAVMKVLTDEGAMQVAMHLPANTGAEPPRPEGHVAYVPKSGSLIFVGMHLAPLEIDKTYELWVIPANGKDPAIPAGTFKPDARGYASVMLPELPKGVAAGSFGVTIEDDGGSKSPTLPIVLAGM
jgi:hypothetical protein